MRLTKGLAVPLLGLCAVVLGCEETKSVGSGCANGVCPQALSRNDDACATSIVHAEVAVRTLDDERWQARVCLPAALTRRDDGTVDARVYYFLTEEADAAIGCTDEPFLQPVSATVREELADIYPGAEICEVKQLAVTQVDGGDPVVAAGDGFFYDDFSGEAEAECTGEPPVALNFTDGADPWNGVLIHLTTAETRNADGEVDAALTCEAIPGSAPVGTACLPNRTVFDDSEIVIESRNEACGDGLCMAYHLGGDVDPSCEEGEGATRCAIEQHIEERVYCTCRCDGPPGSAELCECPDGFSCADAVPSLVPALAGSYCVRDSSIID